MNYENFHVVCIHILSCVSYMNPKVATVTVYTTDPDFLFPLLPRTRQTDAPLPPLFVWKGSFNFVSSDD